MRAFRLAAILLALAPASARAHPLAPALLELREVGAGRVDVRWKTSLWKPNGPAIEPILPADCEPASEPTVEDDATGRTERWVLQCAASLVGAEVGVRGLTATNAIVVVRVADGRVLQTVLDAGNPRFVIPERPAILDVLRDYAELGIEHILFGSDHLLFVFGLILLAGSGRRLVATVTAFTLGHSVTLALATLGYAMLPSGPVELLIALTILWLAVELADDSGPPSWTRRRPWAMAGLFGLLHGLGFAGALREVGLPEGEIPLALLSFNLGIEAGQLVFVAAVLAAALTLRRQLTELSPMDRKIPVYVMGTLAAYWCFERAAALW